SRVILPTDNEVKTVIETDIGLLSMEEYFVKERCKPDVVAVRYSNSEQATATDDAIQAIHQADILIFAPSNPIASIGPILAVREIRSAIETSLAYRVAMSPLVGGKAIKGPASEMMTACGYESNVMGVAAYYYGLLDAIVIDQQDRQYETVLQDSGIDVFVQETMMYDQASRIAVAQSMCSAIEAQMVSKEEVGEIA
ncbi:MAG: YvcK family protein, partial [Arenicella sp.]|nr:YvcK family protein [Arenicella sp.]